MLKRKMKKGQGSESDSVNRKRQPRSRLERHQDTAVHVGPDAAPAEPRPGLGARVRGERRGVSRLP